MTHYGNLSMTISLLLLISLSLYLGLYVGIFGGILSFFRFRYLDEPGVIAPLIWVLLEYLRTYLFTGFPWGLLGYSQYQNLSLIQICDITGVYGVSFMIVMVNAAIYLVIKWSKFYRATFPFRYTLLTLGLFLLVIAYGNFRKEDVQLINKRGPHLQVGIIQGNIEQEQKWEPNYLYNILLIHQKLTLEASRVHPDLIVWPETAVPCYFMPELKFAPFLQALSNRIKTPIIFGSLALETKNDGSDKVSYFNSAFLALPGKQFFPRYDKIHLVPFGEYVPLKFLLPFVEKMVVGIGDFSPGHQYTLFSIPQARFGVLICYEVIFPNLACKYRRLGADFLVNITNDAWFGRTGAPYQHFSMAVFRAIENRTALVRSANTGISGIISPTGYIQSKTPLFVRTFIQGAIPVNPQQPTFYSRYGDIGVAFCGIIILILIVQKKIDS
jgi:apolipoprotein N-acyltransferase